MTVIAAVRRGGQTWVASDGQVESGGYRYREGVFKWRPCALSVQGGRRWVGVAGALALLELLEGCDASSGTAMRASVLQAVEELCRRHKLADLPVRGNPSVVFAGEDGIWEYDVLASGVRVRDWCAFGSGGGEARGVLYALHEQASSLSPEEMLRCAVAAAIAMDTGCGEPIFVEKLGA